MKKWISTALIALMLLSLAACGGEESAGPVSGASQTVSKITFQGTAFEGTLNTEQVLDAAELYQSIEYIPEMFYGNYVYGESTSLSSAEKTRYIEQVGFSQADPRSVGVEYGDSFTAIPYSLVAGPDNLNHVLSFIEGRNAACLYFLTDQKNLDYIYADYQISGNQIIFTPFLHWDYHEEDKSMTYEMADVQLVYEFSFCGPELTLSSGGKSITLSTNLHGDSSAVFGCTGDGYLKPGTETIDGLESISMFETNWRIFGEQNGKTINNIAAELRRDGLMTLTWTDLQEVVHTRQMVYFICDFNGFVFADQEGTYCYTASWTEFRNGALADNLSAEEIDSLNSMTDAQVEAIVQKKADLVADLAAACAQAGLDVTVNAQTGEITLDAGVLFGINESEVTPEGRAFLNQFVDVYTTVVFDEKYDGFISRILVEGHTDTNGSYEMNLELSQNRADSVKAYCLSDDCGVSADRLAALESMIQAEGRSYDQPIYGENGEVDMAASRRVSFRLLISLTGE